MKMKSYVTVTLLLVLCLSVNAEDKSISEYFIAPDTAEYAHEGAIHISKQSIKDLPAISFPENALLVSPQDAVKKAIAKFVKWFPNAKRPEFVGCSLKKFPKEIAENRYYYLISIAPVDAEEEMLGGSVVHVGRIYNMVVPIGRDVVHTPALAVRKKG